MALLQQSPWYHEILQQGVRQERIAGIELALELKFGSEGLELMPAISQIKDLERLKAIQVGIMKANTLDELREII